MRKFLVLLIMVSMLIIPFTSFAQTEETGVKVSSKSAILIDSESKRVMFEKDADKKLPIASVTKVMTLLLTFEAIDSGLLKMDEKVTASESAASMGGSQVFIDAGYDYSVENLIKSVIIASGNDAAVLLSERISGSEDAFVVKMNKRAQELGMNNTTFKNCTGLPENDHLSTARDVAIMSSELLKHDQYFKWGTIWMDKLKHDKDGRTTELVNTNKLIRSLNGCDGLKTGYTSDAGFCVTATAKRGDMRLISVILGGTSSKDRFNEAATLINYGFANYQNNNAIQAGSIVGTINLKGSVDKNANLMALNDFHVCVKNDGTDKLETRIEIPESISAPVNQGQQIGKVIISLNGNDIGQVPLVSQNEHKKAGFIDRLKGIISFWN